MSIGSNIKKIRESRNITVDEMVKKLSIFRRTYINIENNLERPGVFLSRIANILNVDERDIVNYKENVLKNEILRINLKNLKDILPSLEIEKKPKSPSVILTPVTKTPINVVLEDLTVKEVSYKKNKLLKSSEIIQLGDKVKIVGFKDSLSSETLINEFGGLSPNLFIDEERSFASELLNWTEPFTIDGVDKTLFFTKFNTGLKIGDKVFIINGNYDSDDFINKNRYKSKTDGYLVLFVDNCRVVLDIDYQNGLNPFIEEPIDNFINVYLFKTRGDFLKANRQVTTRGGEFSYKFEENQNNIAFFDKPFDELPDGWGRSNGITQSGFYVKEKNSNSWINITNDILSGSFSNALSPSYHTNGKMKINNGNFIEFDDKMVYNWEPSGNTYSWVIDTKYNTPIITKSNFRNGDFNGTFNSGVFGTQREKATWDSDKFNGATWNTGFLLNSNWLSGEIKSKNSLLVSFSSEFDEENLPYQKLNAPNNNGFGFNYIKDSNIKGAVVENGYFKDTNIGQSTTYSVLEDYILKEEEQLDIVFNGAKIKDCFIDSSLIKGADVINSRASNSKFENIKSINSNYKSSVVKDSIYIGDNNIKILAYDEFSMAEKGNDRHSHKVYKFYISEDSYNKLKIRDRVYITGLRILDNSKYPLNFFDRRFRISSWTEYFDSYKDNQFIKRGFDAGVFLSTPGDNSFRFNYAVDANATPEYRTVITSDNKNSKYHSLDIIVSTYDIDDDIIEPDGVTNELPINGLSINTKLDASYIGKQDSEFVANQGFEGKTNVIVVDNDDKVLIGGNFNNYKGQFSPFIIRLNSDGSIDQTFNVGEGFDGEVLDIKIDLDGKIVVGGKFSSYQGIDSVSLIKLNNDGSVDNTFKLKHGTGNQRVNTIQVDENNRLLVGGLFDTYESPAGDEESDLKNILRLQDDSFDNAFNNVINNYIDGEEVKVIKESGKIHIGGEFIDDIGLITISDNGEKLQDYNNSILAEDIISVNTIEIQGDFIFIGGIIKDGTNSVDKLAKIDISDIDNPIYDGDETFNGTINHIKINNDKIYVLGGFTDGIKVYDLNLSEDVDFNPPNRFDGETTNCDFYSNRLYVAGEFTSYNNQRYRNIVRIKLFYSDLISIGNNIDFTNAYIVNSDFESGIIENSDWISGNHINYSNDVNIVDKDTSFGTYSITAITQSSQLIINTGYTESHREIGSGCLEVGNIVFLNGVEYTSPSGGVIKLSDTYKIVDSFTNSNQITLEEVGENSISSITQSGGEFSTIDAQNRYNYIYKSKINKSKISSGIFRRSYISESFIENKGINLSDRDFSDITKLRNLIISDSIVKNNSNILSNALYMNSSFVEGDDKFENGIVYNSIWNGLKFENGLFKESRWVDGEFSNGLFYDNRSFDGITSSNALFFDSERIKSYYKDGITTATQSNDRYSWQGGDFNDGGFFESDWENGNFNGGDFYLSKFYGGEINGGFIGNESIPISETIVYNANINFTTVKNARFISSNNFSGSTSSIVWNDGIFNNGEFGSDNDNIAIWKNGEFNSGNFENMAIWENGKFNGGNFISTYGWTMSDSLTQSNYTWQDGEFNGGLFGNANGASNSTWFNGQFNGGKFAGRVWNDGVFKNGEFLGSATYSAIRNVTSTSSNALLFTESFTSSYYGLWRNGIVSNKKQDLTKDVRPIRLSSRVEPTSAVISNSLWLGGTFSHSSGEIINSVWLDGAFERGKFINSSFNPHVNRNGESQPSFELSDSCRWINGELLDSDFYISKWEKGKFDKGDAYGMIWQDGVCNYMNAFNIFWEDGLWRNGNWYGSYINYDGSIEDDFNKQILLRGVSWSGTQSMHLWNIFDDYESFGDVSSASASEITTLSPNQSFPSLPSLPSFE